MDYLRIPFFKVLALIVLPGVIQAQILRSAICEQFYLKDSKVTVLDLIKKRASAQMVFPPESYFPYLRKFFPEFSDVELIMLMASMDPSEMTYVQITSKGPYTPRSQFYHNHTPSRWIVSRRVLKAAGSTQITFENVQKVYNYLRVQSNKHTDETYRTLKEHLAHGYSRGLSTEAILAALSSE